MKNIFIIAALITLASCGKDNDTQPIPSPVSTPVKNVSILSEFKAIDGGLHGVETLNFHDVTLNEQVEETFCNGTYGNSGDVNGVERGHSLLEGTQFEGILQYGHLAYVGASNPLCRAMSKERYTYKITGKKLTLCMVNYPFCEDYLFVE